MAAHGVRAALALAIVGGLLSIASSGPTTQLQRRADSPEPATVFETQELESTFDILKSRNCLPANFTYAKFVPTARDCAGKLDTGCEGVPPVATFYNCVADSAGLIGDASFNMAAFEAHIDDYTDDAGWEAKAKRLLADCELDAGHSLTARQHAVFTYTCWKWSLFLDCDRQEEQRQEATLSDEASLRRARFLAGTCPLSPRLLLDVTESRWAECSGDKLTIPAGTATDSESQQQYATEVSRISCLLRGFLLNTFHINFDSLLTAIQSSGGYSTANAQLREIVKLCGKESPADVTWKAVTAEEFVKCWTRMGIFSCAHAEANQLANQFHRNCAKE